jgi:hypothetical protein
MEVQPESVFIQQPDFMHILDWLAEFPYVQRIDAMEFE